MNLSHIQYSIDDINSKIRDRYSDHENEVFPILDGAFDPAEYYSNQSYKIMWLMKEPYEKDERYGDWSLPDFFKTNFAGFYNNLVKGIPGRTWQPVVYTSYGLLNQFKKWDEMSFIRDKPDMVKILGKISWVNIQKLPSETGCQTHYDNIKKAYTRNKDILNEQIDLLDPDIIICGNTFSIIKEDWGRPKEEKFDMLEYCNIGKRLIINAYHPAQFNIKRERYVNNIIETVKNWAHPYLLAK